MSRRVSRAEALQLGLGALGVGSLLVSRATLGRAASGRVVAGHHHVAAKGVDFTSPRRPPFEAELFIPPDAQPISSSPAGDVYHITEKVSTSEIVPGFTTPIWGYDGIFPGPTIRARKGRPVTATFTNQVTTNEDAGLIIPFPTDPVAHPFRPGSLVVHLHGINAPAISDGYPTATILPGQSFTHHYPNDEYQRPATLWYHDHSVHITGQHVYRGLSAFYILTDEIEDGLPLPKGEFDVPLVLRDLVMDQSGVLVYDNEDHKGVAGDLMTVNGRQQPRFAVANRKYRFRILNGSDAREYRLALSDRSQFTVIGSDQGLLASPEPARTLRIAPAERYEIVIDFSQYKLGTRVVLQNLLPEPQDRDFKIGNPDPRTRDLMAFDVVRRASDDSTIPATLRPFDPISPSLAVRTRQFEFNRSDGYFSINGRQFDPNRVDATPRLGTAEIWNVINESGGWTHPVHIHLVRFLIVSLQGRPRQPGESGWKDVVWLGPNVSARVLMQFENFPGKFVFHCHNSSHEDHDMMSQFQTV